MSKPDPNQLELPLDYPSYDRYTIKLCKGAIGDMHVLREHSAKDSEAALTMIEGLRDAAAGRDGVTWQNDEPDLHGELFGLATGGVVWMITVVPPLNEPLNQ